MQPHRFVCAEHESDKRGAWHSRKYPGYRAAIEAARKHVDRYHMDKDYVMIDIDRYTKTDIRPVAVIGFET